MAPDAGRLLRSLDLSGPRKLIVAVSGGSDSLSLLFLTHSFLQAHAPATPLLAVTVDHGLRPGAAAEARKVGDICRAHGIAHRILVWQGDKPKTGTIAAAREARYALLAQAAQDFGSDCILTGHTLDDQAETVAMRSERGAGMGLAGMATATLFDDRVWIVRPLLRTRRQALRDYLDTLGIAWIDDPTNENRLYERVRARTALAGTDTVETLCATADEAGEARRQLSGRAAILVSRYLTMPSPGLFRLDRAIFAEDRSVAGHALRAVLAVAGGTPFLPDMKRAMALFDRLCTGDAARVPLSRAMVDARKGALWIRRESRGLPQAAPLIPPVLWDGRWRISADIAGERVQVGPLGADRAADIMADAEGVPASLALAALALEPALSGDDNTMPVVLKAGGGVRSVAARRVASPWTRFLPDFDIALAGALALAMSESPPPETPWKDHIGT